MWEAKGSRHEANSQLLPIRCYINYGISTWLLAVTKHKEESPYKPETTLLCVKLRTKNELPSLLPPKNEQVLHSIKKTHNTRTAIYELSN